MLLQLNENYTISCKFVNCQNGFRHVAKVLKNGWIDFETSCKYQNRTWECYEFETVIKQAINDYFNEPLKSEFMEKIQYKNLYKIRG